MVWTGAQSPILAQEKLKWDLIHMLDHSGQGRETLVIDTFDLWFRKRFKCLMFTCGERKDGGDLKWGLHQVSSHLARVCIHHILSNTSILLFLPCPHHACLSCPGGPNSFERSYDPLCLLSMILLHSVPMETTDTFPMMPSLLDFPLKSGSATKRRQSLLTPDVR